MNSDYAFAEAELLFARPSFLAGTAALMDFAGALDVYNASSSPHEADARALASDWRAVGRDIACAIERYAVEHEQAAAHSDAT
ncbi:MAG: hypothetical protein FJX72_05410 [Armatimonadetes bacterium]|nr:hypothetical protein [Armatimonadota bacterium]